MANGKKNTKDKKSNSNKKSTGNRSAGKPAEKKQNRSDDKKTGRSAQTKNVRGGSDKKGSSGSGMSVKESRGGKEIIAIILAAVGVFLIFSLFGKTGQIGRAVMAVLIGIMGRFATVVGVAILFILAFTLLRGTSGRIFSLKNCILFAFMLLFCAALIHTFAHSVEIYDGKSFFEIATQMWKEQDHSGGVTGGMVSFGLQKLVARPGTLIILIPATLILAMVLFSLSVVRAAKKIASAGGKIGDWLSGVIARFKRSDSKKNDSLDKKKRKDARPVQKTPVSSEDDEENGNGSGRDADGDYVDADPYGLDEVAADYGADGRDVSDDQIELISARGKRRDVFKTDLERQKELHKAAERKIMSQEDDDAPFAVSRTQRSADDYDAAIAAGKEAAGAGISVVTDDDFGGSGDDFGNSITEIQDREMLPSTDATIPTKPPLKNEEIRVVTCDENAVYELPPKTLLKSVETDDADVLEQEKNAKLTARKLEDVMRSFGIEARVIRISIGSTVTMFELQPQSGVKVSRIKNLSDDIALNLAASGVRILAPIPGKAAIGIEVPNEDRRTVYLKDLIESEAFSKHRSKLAFCLGEDISGTPIIADISKMPHVLIAGTTGSGKSVCINCLVMSLLYRCSPNDVRLIMIDPKVVELQVYNSIPHLLVPVVTEPRKAAAALSWTVQEMENRYRTFAKYNLRDINSYNEYAPDHKLPRMPRIVIIIDELADLMMVVRDSVEEAINRIAQKARAAGMHLIVATQRPSVDVITGLIKANIPSRIAFTVSSVVDSKTILDYGGAEKLLGRGDMLYHPVDFMKPIRVQGGFVSDIEIEDTVDFLRNQKPSDEQERQISSEIDSVRPMEKPGRGGRLDADSGEHDPMLADAIDIAIEAKQISASFLQRRLGLGYSRAARLIDQMEAKGFISAKDGNNPRQVLISQNPLR